MLIVCWYLRDLLIVLCSFHLQRDLVEETISYIAYLEGILQMANEKVRLVWCLT